MKYEHDYSKETLSEIVSKCSNLAQVCRAYGITSSSGNYKTIKKKIQEFNIDISHFTRKLKKVKVSERVNNIEDILVENSPYQNISSLKKKILKQGLMEYKCAICGISEWLGNPLSLQLDHINGISNDHRLENLRLVCPNCHSQTETFAGRNVKLLNASKTE
jgi:Zn finger protein HypA/HybF involved in hydrogenase expression